MRWLLPPLLLGALLPPAQDRAASGTAGVVAAEHKDGVAAGIGILEKGGNAVDAAVAAAFAMGVALPSHSGLGGRSQFLIVLKDGTARHVDGGAEVPKGWTRDADGRAASICTPGSVAALALALKESGTMKWADVLEPAIALAKRRRGMGDLAATLELLRDKGPEDFYTGELAGRVAADLAERGALVSKEDLAAYKARTLEPLRGRYRGFEVLSAGPPGHGPVVIEALQILDRFDVAKLDSEADREHVLIEALRLAYEDRRNWSPERVKAIVAADHAATRAKSIDLTKAGTPDVPDEHEGDTTHITVVDRDGNVAAFTQTLGPWFGAGKCTSLGFYWNATQGVAGTVGPGERHTTGMSPTVLLKDGKPWLVLGSAGDMRIMSALVCTIHRIVDRGLPVGDAVDAPRWHWQGNRLMRETRLKAKSLETPASVIETLAARGFSAASMPSNPYFGRLQAAIWDSETKTWHAAADPRNTTGAAAAADAERVRAATGR